MAAPAEPEDGVSVTLRYVSPEFQADARPQKIFQQLQDKKNSTEWQQKVELAALKEYAQQQREQLRQYALVCH